MAAEWTEVQYPEKTPGPIYEFRRGYRVRDAGKHENADHFAVFQQYLRLPSPRSLTRLSEITGHSIPSLEKWRSIWQWERRSAAWQKDQLALTYRDVDKLKRDTHKQAIIEFRNASERQARMMSRVSEDLVKLLGRRIQEAEDNQEAIPMHLVGGLLRAASSLNEQSRQAWGHALGVNELLEVVENEVEQVRVKDADAIEVDPYEFEIEE